MPRRSLNEIPGRSDRKLHRDVPDGAPHHTVYDIEPPEESKFFRDKLLRYWPTGQVRTRTPFRLAAMMVSRAATKLVILSVWMMAKWSIFGQLIRPTNNAFYLAAVLVLGTVMLIMFFGFPIARTMGPLILPLRLRVLPSAPVGVGIGAAL